LSPRRICQINLSAALGGAEVYAHFFTKALLAVGCETELFVREGADFWNSFDFGDAHMTPVRDAGEIAALLPGDRRWIVIHSPVPSGVLEFLRSRHRLAGLAHQALYDHQRPAYYDLSHLLIPVSQYVIATLEREGLSQIYREPLLGVADLSRGQRPGAAIVDQPLYDWDRNKLRDRVFSAFYPALRALTPRRTFLRRPGIALGIVSRIAPLKQFTAQFEVLAPVLASFPQVSLEIFGSGVGYKPVRDLRHALAPIADRVRFWGEQGDVAAIYPQLDYLLTGLPEREALGLNALEAQICGTPVLAVRAPPFTETVIEGETGFFYADPREDGGADFRSLMQRLVAAPDRPDPRKARAHIERFSMPAFVERVGRLADHLSAAD
jgi:glycosyltransferase involved in cell wall biosynthesis